MTKVKEKKVINVGESLDIFGIWGTKETEPKEKFFDKDEHLKNMISEYHNMKSDIKYLKRRIDSRMEELVPKDQTVYVPVKITGYNYRDEENPLVGELESGDQVHLNKNDIIDKTIFESPMGELLYGQVSKGSDSNNNEEGREEASNASSGE